MATATPGTLQPVVEPTTQTWLDQLAAAGGRPLFELSPADARAVLRGVQASVPVELPPADVRDLLVPGGPTGDVGVRIVRPLGAVGALPLVMHLHGGGWILGGKDTHERLYREL